MQIFSAKAIRIPYTWPEKTRFVLQGFARVAKDEQHAAGLIIQGVSIIQDLQDPAQGVSII